MARRRQYDTEQESRPKLSKETLRQAISIFQYIRPYRWHLIGGLILLFFSSIIFMVFPYLAGLMVDVAQGTVEGELTLSKIGLGLLVILLIQGSISYSRVLLFANVSERGIADVRQALYQKLVSLPIVFFEQNRVGELISRLTADVERLYSAFSVTLAEFIRQILILITGIIFLAVTTPRLALIMLATFPVIVIGAMFFGRYIRKLSRERQKALADTNTVLSETMQSIHTVKAFTNEKYELNRYSTGIHGVVKIALRFAQGRALFSVFIVSVLFGALFFVIWQGAMMVQSGEIRVGQLIAFVSYTAIIGGAIAGLGNFYTELLGAVGATERIREILNEKEELHIASASSSTESRVKIFGKIQFENVHFQYPTRPDIPVLKGLDLEIQPGQKIALVGPSGAGKSTIVQLLLRFYPYQNGQILVDNKPIEEYNIQEYRNNFSIVPQEVLLFGGTIRENILYGKPDATEEEVLRAAELSNSMEFINLFPEKLDTIVGERGVKLSGGQRQRIAIARAILRDPAVLLLDEATSSLDTESEKVVQDALNVLMEGRTSIIIAHRLSTIRDADIIYVIDAGKIVEQGSHENLYAIEEGLYSSLAKMQK